MKEVIKYFEDNVTKKSITNYVCVLEPWSHTAMYVKHGMYQLYHPNGEMRLKGEYCFGKRRGAWINFLDDGHIFCTIGYSHQIDYSTEDELLEAEDSETDYETGSDSDSESENNNDIKMKISDEVFEAKEKLTDSQFKSIMELLQKIT